MIVEPLPQAPAKVSRREFAAPEHSPAAPSQPPKSLQPLCTVFSWTHSRIALPFLQTARFHTRTRRLMVLRRAFSNRIPQDLAQFPDRRLRGQMTARSRDLGRRDSFRVANHPEGSQISHDKRVYRYRSDRATLTSAVTATISTVTNR